MNKDVDRFVCVIWVSTLVGLTLALLLMLLSGCDRDRHSEPPNTYLLSCSVAEEGDVRVNLSVPEGFYAVISQDYLSFDAVAMESGIYSLGVLEEGEHIITLTVYIKPSPTHDPFAYDGYREFCTVPVPEQEFPPPEDGPEEENPTEDEGLEFQVHTSSEGIVLVVLRGDYTDCPVYVTLSRLDPPPAGVVDRVTGITTEGEVTFGSLVTGSYMISVVDCRGYVLFAVEVYLDSNFQGGDLTDEDDEETCPTCCPPCEPGYGKACRVYVCKDGRTLLIPRHVALKWIRKGKAVLGSCQ